MRLHYFWCRCWLMLLDYCWCCYNLWDDDLFAAVNFNFILMRMLFLLNCLMVLLLYFWCCCWFISAVIINTFAVLWFAATVNNLLTAAFKWCCYYLLDAVITLLNTDFKITSIFNLYTKKMCIYLCRLLMMLMFWWCW